MHKGERFDPKLEIIVCVVITLCKYLYNFWRYGPSSIETLNTIFFEKKTTAKVEKNMFPVTNSIIKWRFYFQLSLKVNQITIDTEGFSFPLL